MTEYLPVLKESYMYLNTYLNAMETKNIKHCFQNQEIILSYIDKIIATSYTTKKNISVSTQKHGDIHIKGFIGTINQFYDVLNEICIMLNFHLYDKVSFKLYSGNKNYSRIQIKNHKKQFKLVLKKKN